MYLRAQLMSFLVLSSLTIAVQTSAGPNANAVLSLDLIPDGGTGNRIDDGVTSGGVSGIGQTIAVEVFSTGVNTPLVGFVLKLDVDASLLAFIKAENSQFPLTLPEGSAGTNFATGTPVSLASSGFLARAEFETIVDVTDRAFSIGIEIVRLAESTTSGDVLTTNRVIAFNSAPSPDFDGDGTVGFSDFLQFAERFGEQQGDARFDLDGDGKVGFSDFLILARHFGKEVSPPGNREPDLIVDAPDVSDTVLTPGQSFTLDVAVRNRGRVPSVSTILRYYRSPDATVSWSDVEVGTSIVGGLAPSAVAEASTALRAPSSAGTYFYGACVEPVSGESDTGNNCSHAVGVTVTSSSFRIELVFIEGANGDRFNASQKALFHRAAARWMSVITGDIPGSAFSDNPVDEWDDDLNARIRVNDFVDDLRIFAGIGEIDGARGTLGRGGTLIVRRNRQSSALVTVIGTIAIDRDDLAWMSDAFLSQIILHEMAHVLGFGTVWRTLNLVRGGSDRYFTGPLAIRAFDNAGGRSYNGPKVPVEDDSGHWRGSVFGDELMTARIRPDLDGTLPLSAITIQSLADHGYKVNAGLADEYRLPAPASAKPVAVHVLEWGDCVPERPVYVVDENGRVVDVIAH